MGTPLDYFALGFTAGVVAVFLAIWVREILEGREHDGPIDL